MRQLKAKQKRLLKKWYDEHTHLNGLGCFSIELCDEFNYDLYEELREINDTEILHQCIEQFVSDLALTDLWRKSLRNNKPKKELSKYLG